MNRQAFIIGIAAVSFVLGGVIVSFLSPLQIQKLNPQPLGEDEVKQSVVPSVITNRVERASNPSPKLVANEENQIKETPAASNSDYDRLTKILNENFPDPELLKTKNIQEAAIKGILASLNGSAKLINTNDIESAVGKNTEAFTNAIPVDDTIAYIKLNKIDSEIAAAFESEINSLIAKDNISNLIIDLRYSSSTNFTAVPELSSLFLSKEELLFGIMKNGKTTQFRTSTNARNLSMPVVLLVNHQTKGAFELFAAILQEKGRAIIIGNSSTASQIYETADVKFSKDEMIEVACSKIVLSDGKELFLKPVTPDVTTMLSAKAEKEIFSKPFQKPQPEPEVRFFSEAILTGKEVPPPISQLKKKNAQHSGPASNRDITLLTAMDVLRSVRALGLTPEKSTGFSSETSKN